MSRALAWLGTLLRFAAGLIVVPAAFVLGVGGGFLGGLRAYERFVPVPSAAVPDERPPFELSREQLDAMLGPEPEARPAEPKEAAPEAPPAEPGPPPPEPAPPVEPADAGAEPGEAKAPADALPQEQYLPRTTALIRLHRAADASLLAALSCDELTLARNWLWASRGYVFTSSEGKAMFAGREGYRPDPKATLESVEAAFTEVDQANRNLLTGALHKEGCPCPAGKPQQPCPE